MRLTQVKVHLELYGKANVLSELRAGLSGSNVETSA